MVVYEGLIVSTYFCVNVLNSESMSDNVTAVQDSLAAWGMNTISLNIRWHSLLQWGIQAMNSKNLKSVIKNIKVSGRHI
jgi:hypothetical protein